MTQEDEFLNLLKKKHVFYSSILEITKEEGIKLERGDPLKEIRDLVEKKKAILRCIASLEEEIAPLKMIWKEHPEKKIESSQSIQQEIEELSLLLDEILKRDTLNQKHLHSQYTLSLKNGPS